MLHLFLVWQRELTIGLDSEAMFDSIRTNPSEMILDLAMFLLGYIFAAIMSNPFWAQNLRAFLVQNAEIFSALTCPHFSPGFIPMGAHCHSLVAVHITTLLAFGHRIISCDWPLFLMEGPVYYSLTLLDTFLHFRKWSWPKLTHFVLWIWKWPEAPHLWQGPKIIKIASSLLNYRFPTWHKFVQLHILLVDWYCTNREMITWRNKLKFSSKFQKFPSYRIGNAIIP